MVTRILQETVLNPYTVVAAIIALVLTVTR